jgi:hypothetical protein
MTMKIHGTLTRLKRLLADNRIAGSWEAKANGVYMMRCPDGANLHWASGNKSIWFSGKPVPKHALETLLAGILHELEEPG